MAIKPGYKSFTFDGENSGDYGVYITGSAVYNAPARDVEMISIPGRSGAFVQDNGRFENIEVTYPAGIYAESQEDFAQALSNLRNMLASRKGYCRLTDEYNPEEYRMAVYKSGLDVDPVAFQRAGEFEITFDCKPQRFLTSGESAVSVTSGDTLTNPTLFESSPLLEVEGYGTIEFNGYEIELENALMGSLTLLNQGVYSTGIRNSKYILTFNDNQFNTGDNITVNGLVAAVDHVNGYSYEGGVYKSTQINSLSLVSDSLTGANTSIVDLAPTSTSKSYKISTAFPDFTFTVGTASQIKNRALFSGTATVDNQSRTFSDQILEASISYDGSGTIEFYLTSWATGGRVYLNFLTNVYGTFETTGVIGDSTLSLLGNPTYIDCDLGEAYLINGGVPVSLNAYIDLGSDLPKLAVGENEITFDNTVTDLTITPRWWKI